MIKTKIKNKTVIINKNNYLKEKIKEVERQKLIKSLEYEDRLKHIKNIGNGCPSATKYCAKAQKGSQK